MAATGKEPRRPKDSPPSGGRARELSLAVALAALALLPPLALIRLPGVFAPFASPHLEIAALLALALAPLTVAAALLFFGFEGLLQRFEGSGGAEPRVAVLRLFAAAALFVHGLGLALIAGPSEAAAAVLLIASLALLYAWLFFFQLILVPRFWRLRQPFAAFADSGLLSLLLYAGGGSTAFWVPAYFLLALGNGFSSGLSSLLTAAAASVLGFAAVAAATPFWRGEPALALGLLLALVLLPASTSPLLRRLAQAPEEEEREEEKSPEVLALPAPASIRIRESETAKVAAFELFRLFAAEMRRGGEAILRLAAGFEEETSESQEREKGRALQMHARALLQRCEDMRDLGLAALAGSTAENTVFDLYEAAFGALAMLRAEAAAKGIRLSLRIDPRLPYQLIGSPHGLRQILLALIGRVLGSLETGTLRVEVGAAGRGHGKIRFRFAIRISVAPPVETSVLPVLARLVEGMGGGLSANGLDLELPFALSEEAPAEVDLCRGTVLIASEDVDFAENLLAWLQGFNAEVRMIGLSEAALPEILERIEGGPVLIVDGRNAMLPSLSFAYRAAAGERARVFLVADEAHFDSLAAIADDLLAAILPAPLAKRVLAAALHAVEAARQEGSFEPAPAPGAPMSAEEEKRPASVLLAEEDEGERKRIGAILAAAGYRVHLAANRHEALDALSERGIDLMLMGIDAPEIGAYEAGRLYQMAQPRLPILALTVESGFEAERLCREAGVDVFLTKSEQPARLLQLVGAQLGAKGQPASPPPTVTPIASHPRFAGEREIVIEEGTIAALRALGEDSDFFATLLDAFRTDSAVLFEDLRRAAKAADANAFRETLQALKSCAANIGGVRLVELLGSLREVTEGELRLEGGALVDRIGVELMRLEVALDNTLSLGAGRQ